MEVYYTIHGQTKPYRIEVYNNGPVIVYNNQTNQIVLHFDNVDQIIIGNNIEEPNYTRMGSSVLINI
jgi:hypothetical protein